MRQFKYFSWQRFVAMVIKEFVQMRRDRMTFAIMIGIPLIQLTLFGLAINSDPKHLPTGVLMADQGPQARTLVTALENSGYFHIIRQFATEDEAQSALSLGEVQFVVNIPVDFERDLLRDKRPAVLVEADATDPASSSNAISSLPAILAVAFENEFQGPLAYLATPKGPIDLRVHALYNPDVITQYNIVPGLMGVVLTMTMVMITSLAITRERESGTMETLLAMPTRPFEVMLGKIIPYIVVGYIQLALILLAARFLFHVPMVGSVFLVFGAALFFIAANLSVGITFSTIAMNQRQAMQMSFFFFLPSILLSGFMFPFRGMPNWAQSLGEILPLTHFIRIVRGILLKGHGPIEISFQLWQIILFVAVVLTIGIRRYRETLD